MIKMYNKLLLNKLGMFLVLGWICLSTSSCTFNYYAPSTTISFTGTTSVCQGAASPTNTLNYGDCTLGGGIINSGVTCTLQWYYNTTGSTSIGSSTPLGAPTFFT